MGKIEIWNNHPIRFVEHNGEWWAVAKDIAEALDYSSAKDMLRQVDRNEIAGIVINPESIGNGHKVPTSEKVSTSEKIGTSSPRACGQN